METKEVAALKGRQAYHAGKQTGDNPYGFGSANYSAWYMAYLAEFEKDRSASYMAYLAEVEKDTEPDFGDNDWADGHPMDFGDR